MQPLKNKRTKIQSGVSRARVLLKRDLGWLPGYPLHKSNIGGNFESTLKWQPQCVGAAADSSVVSLDGEHLRRAQMTITKLRHHFPRALPKIVDDVDDWLRRTDFLLGMLKNFVHHGQTFCANDVLSSGTLPVRWTAEVTRLKCTHKSLAGLLDAVTFGVLSDRRTCDLEPLQWINKHAAELTLLSNADLDRPCELSIRMLAVRDNLSSELIRSLVRCLTDPLIRECQWKSPDRRLMELRSELVKASKQHEFKFPQASSGETLDQVVRAVFTDACSVRPKPQRRTFELLEQILTEDLVDRVAKTQRKITVSEKRSSRLLRRFETRQESIPQTKAGRNHLKKKVAVEEEFASDEMEIVRSLGYCLGMLTRLDATESRVWVDLLAPFAREHASLRVRLLAKWWRDGHRLGVRRNDFMRIIKALSALTRRGGIAPTMLKHWHGYVDGKHSYSEFVVNTYHEMPGNRQLEVRAVRLLERVAYDLQLDLGCKLLSSLVEFAQATDDNELSCSLIEHLVKQSDEEYNATDLRLAFHFGDSIAAISEVLAALLDNYELSELATQLKPLADDPDLKLIVAKHLVANNVSVLSPIAASAAILIDSGQPIPKRQIVWQPTEWMNHYPSDFETALNALAKVTHDAERIAETVLGKAFPSPEKLQQQIEALDSKVAVCGPDQTGETRLHLRLANLRRRKTETASVSPARRDKLIEKLERRTELEFLQQYAITCRKQASAATQVRFNLKVIPDEWWQPPLDRVLRQINRLDKPMQELGIRLLFETLDRKTRTFDEEPRNLAFRKRMEASGLLVEPWLSDQTKQTASTADGTPYELAFTRDVIDFLLMGFHFDTCLSPDSFNFFSTIANAVDLNKRVVYGKTAEGKIIGRCLFALNDSGEILTYHRYSHDPKDCFANAIDQFAQRLATEMQTSIAASGNVSKLVARLWYDDGPWPTESDWLGDDGVLAKLKDDSADKDILPKLIKAVGRDFLRHRVSDFAIDARVCDRIKILKPLLDEFEDDMSVRQKFRIAVNVEPVAVSYRLLSQLRWSDMIGLVHRHQCNECDVFHGIAEYSKVFRVLSGYHPSLGLRAIRASRPSSIKSDILDLNKTRRTALAQVHQMLGREQLAGKLMES